MKRRSFIEQIIRYAGAGVFSGFPFGLSYLLAPKLEASPETHLPLPGALNDTKEFYEACIGCGLCASVCPIKCIKFFKHAARHQVNTPYINPEFRGCILCGKCMEICPTNALSVTPIDKIKMGIAQIDRVACYPWVDKAICGACVSVCPLGERAIKFDFGNIYRPVIQTGCVGCGQCVEVCPEPSLPIRIVKSTQQTIATHNVV